MYLSRQGPREATEAAVKYLILIYSNPQSREIWESFSEEERVSGYDAYAALSEELAASGELIVTEALGDPSLTKRVSVNELGTMTTDGPFAEVKEQLAGFYLIECDGMDRAVEIAARIPGLAELGLVEVRPVLDLGGLEM
jgi:hypothetical protein